MGYSESIFDVAADIVCSAENSSSANPQKVYEDLVIALSLDTGMSRKEVRSHLAAKLPTNYNVWRWKPACDGLKVPDFNAYGAK